MNVNLKSEIYNDLLEYSLMMEEIFLELFRFSGRMTI